MLLCAWLEKGLAVYYFRAGHVFPAGARPGRQHILGERRRDAARRRLTTRRNNMAQASHLRLFFATALLKGPQAGMPANTQSSVAETT
jgi:hypothetical protein